MEFEPIYGYIRLLVQVPAVASEAIPCVFDEHASTSSKRC